MIVRSLAVLASLLFIGATSQDRPEGWRSLFNGRDLTGWRANTAPDSFAVEGGVLRVRCTAEGRRLAHLFYVGNAKEGFERFRNFELEVTCRAEPRSNSGIFFHTDLATRDGRGHLANGYEVQLNNSPREKRKTGSLCTVRDLNESAVDESAWFTVRVTVRKKRITVAIDGRTLVDYTEPANPVRSRERAGRLLRPEGGAIALQAHDRGSTWYFKQIRIRRLP